MNVALVFLIVIALLFVVAFFTKRRFGVLGLALAAGSILSAFWTEKMTSVVERSGVSLVAPPTISVVAVALVLLPAVLLLFSGPSYSGKLLRAGGALAFAVLATAFLSEYIGMSLDLSGQSKTIYDAIVDNRVYIVTVGLILAIIDVLAIHTKRGARGSKH